MIGAIPRNLVCWIAVGALVSGIAFGGCSRHADEDRPVEVVVQMFEGPEHDAMRPVAQFWNDHYGPATGIEVRVTSLERTGYFGKMQTQLAAGMTSPDIVHPFSLHLGRIAADLEPLDPYLEDDSIATSPDGERASLDALIDAARKTVRMPDGAIPMIPIDLSVVILYYRADLIDHPPETWDEFVDVARRFTRSKNPGSPTRYGAIVQGKYEMWTFCSALEVLRAYGADLLPPQGAASLEPGATERALSVYERLARERLIPPEAIDAECVEVAKAMRSGDVAMALQWNAFYPDRSADDAGGKYAIAPPPGVRLADGTIRRAMYVQTIGLAINARSKHKREAARYLLWATLGDGADLYAEAGGSAPVHDVWDAARGEMPYSTLRPWVDEFGRSVAHDPETIDLMMIGSDWVQRVVAESATAREAAAGMRRDVEGRLSRAAERSVP